MRVPTGIGPVPAWYAPRCVGSTWTDTQASWWPSDLNGAAVIAGHVCQAAQLPSGPAHGSSLLRISGTPTAVTRGWLVAEAPPQAARRRRRGVVLRFMDPMCARNLPSLCIRNS